MSDISIIDTIIDEYYSFEPEMGARDNIKYRLEQLKQERDHYKEYAEHKILCAKWEYNPTNDPMEKRKFFNDNKKCTCGLETLDHKQGVDNE
jgi:hypothetical protein